MPPPVGDAFVSMRYLSITPDLPQQVNYDEEAAMQNQDYLQFLTSQRQ